MDDAVRPRPVSQRSAHVMWRTCVGCRRRDERSVLLRVVAVRGRAGAEDMETPVSPVRVVPDQRRRLPGRGAWLHPASACLAHAIRRRAFGRALRVRERLDVEPLRAWFAQHAQ